MLNVRNSLIFSLLALMLPAALNAAEIKLRDLYFVGSRQAERMWLLKVLDDGIDPIPVYTDVYTRSEGERRWGLAHRIPGAIRQTTLYGPNLVVLLPDGQWLIVGQSSGRPLPENARLLAIHGSNMDLWAIGVRPSYAKPTTTPDTAPLAAAEKPNAAVLYQMNGGGWSSTGAVPASANLDQLAMGSLMGRPVLACGEKGRLVLWRLDEANQWTQLGEIEVAGQWSPQNLIEDAGRLFVYLEDPRGQAMLLTWSGQWESPLMLGTDAAAGGMGLGAGRLRYVYGTAEQISQRSIDPRSLQVDGEDEPIVAQAPSDWRLYYAYAEWAMMAIIVLVLIHTYRKRGDYQRLTPAFDGVRLAPFGQRIFAGMIDALPLIVGILYARLTIDGMETIWDMTDSGEAMQIFAAAAAVWIAHTAFFETLFGRSLGKMLTHLHVVRIDGAKPSRTALLVRNLLRIIDVTLMLTLLLVFYLPLRQRIGDLAASTTVVARRKGDSGRPD